MESSWKWKRQNYVDIIQEVIKMGFERNQVVESLRNRVQNEDDLISAVESNAAGFISLTDRGMNYSRIVPLPATLWQQFLEVRP
ncbi:hypothetical protein FRX31_017237 [Thalictrum thalictroides]|uniref:UBA domain-containing protein n=1 Tax=Thalictrum thalictroides TaxID=46969 RepID=A0A7J6W6Z6_THATH|nr:hypothetical protein FRX31_017237 [Thalictrum thalictroides]